MTKDEIQFWMLIAFVVAFVLSTYKVYIIFSAPAEGISTKTQYDQLEEIIINFLSTTEDSSINETTLFQSLKKLEVLKNDIYKNLNQNRLNQLLNQLYFHYKVDSLSELIKSIKNAR